MYENIDERGLRGLYGEGLEWRMGRRVWKECGGGGWGW